MYRNVFFFLRGIAVQQKDLLVTVGGIAAISAILFGGGLFFMGSVMSPKKEGAEASIPHVEHGSDKHGEADKHGAEKPADKHGAAKPADKHGADAHGKHGEKAAPVDPNNDPQLAAEKHKGPKEPPVIIADNGEELDRFILKYNDLLGRENYNDARSVAMKAFALSSHSDMGWLRRLADATYLSDGLPAHQRYSKAYDYYSTILASSNDSVTSALDLEWAQYRAALCLRQNGRWEDSLESSKAYLNRYADTPRRAEVRLMFAQGLFAQGKRSLAREEIMDLIKSNPPSEVHARALIELAQIDMERVRVEPVEAPIEPLAEVVNLDEPLATPRRTRLSDENTVLPASQWQNVVAAARAGRLQEAQSLIEPWIRSGGPLSSEQRAQVTLRFAKLLRELPTEKSMP